MSGDSRMFKRSTSLTLRAVAQAVALSKTVLSPLRCWMKTGMETVYMETGITGPLGVRRRKSSLPQNALSFYVALSTSKRTAVTSISLALVLLAV
jgi:predicted phage tail protein